MCAAAATGTRRRSKSRRVTSRSRKRAASAAALPSPPSSLEFEEPTSYFAYIRTVLAGIVTNVLIIFIFLTLKSTILVTDFVNLILSSVVFPVVSFYLLWISVHFLGSHMYINQVRIKYLKNLLFILLFTFLVRWSIQPGRLSKITICRSFSCLCGA
jgi:hypothetical protein